MKENICTIPINDVFLPSEGCPLCRMRDMLETRHTEYIIGAAMMEPDVRVMTNKTGFCRRHFLMMLQNGKRLPNALILETHLKYIRKSFFEPEGGSKGLDKKSIAELRALGGSCYICENVNRDMLHMFKTVYIHWNDDEEFKKLYNSQPYICLEHFTQLISSLSQVRGIKGKDFNAFYSASSKLVENQLKTLESDLKHFCSMFDYQNAGGDWGNSRDSIERAIDFLTGSLENSFRKDKS